ncbi:MAG: protein kinase, partial [Myxococcales bacterium]|nr:protein kinase [Myxococcales bacterium]
MKEANAAGAGERFELRGPLGSGGNGVVYRVFDRVRDDEVALKSLRSPGGRELYRFKREFRALADLSHPNLVNLYELYTVADDWMFTMELVDGVGFHQWVRPSPDGAPVEDAAGDVTAPPRPDALAGGLRLGPLDEARLRDALYQLADGLTALHAAGKLHRDVKPSNVLVEPSGRVVLLDFGLVADVDSFHVDRTHERAAVGTPAYMSPEQAADRPLTDAADWYAVGVMLYEALAARRPFDGNATIILGRKQREDPAPPSSFAPGTPADLDALCMRLLSRDPMHRPDGPEVLAALGREPSSATRRIRREATRGPFVGRGAELATLRRAYGDARQRCVVATVLGASGMGKSALVRAFLDEVSVDGEAVILESRCYEREVVPFKALDGVVDGLTAFLVRQPRGDIEKLTPRDVAALMRLFPVMKRVPGLAGTSLPGGLPSDPIELRRRAFGALRELLAEIAEYRPLVIAIDDLQWGDADSASALSGMIQGVDAPRMLVIASHRREDDAAATILGSLRQVTGAELREVDVGKLPAPDARTLWEALGGDHDDAAVDDAAGNPLLIAEMARARAAGAGPISSVDDAVRARMERLDGDARALMAAVAVAVRPLSTTLLSAAAHLPDNSDALGALRSERMVRVRGADAPVVEPYHDRIRQAVLSSLSTEQVRRTHAELARALAVEDTGDRELMVEHWLGAGEGGRASKYAERAARDAEERLAFHRAAELYGLALVHGDMPDAERCALTTRRAQTLASAGRLVEAAVEFRSASSLATGRDKLTLQRKSVEQLLRAGRLDRGLVATDQLLDAVDIRMPRTWRRTVVALVVERARIRLRGLGWDRRAEADVDPDVLDRLDVMWSVSSGFTFVNPVLGRVLQARFLREALAAGEPRRVTLAFGLELGYISMPGEPARERAEALFARARALAAQVDQPDAVGFIEASGGVASYLAGRFREAHDRIHAGELLLRQHSTEMRWQLDLAEIFRIANLWCLGELRELVRVQPIYLRAAEEHGNVYSQRGLRGWRSNVAWLIQGDPVAARAHAERAAVARGKGEPFHLHHYYDVLAHVMIDLYERRGDDALARIDGIWRDLEGAHLFRIQSIDIEASWLRGLAAVAAARHDRDRLDLA